MKKSICSITMSAAIASLIAFAPHASARTASTASVAQEAEETLKEMKGLATVAEGEATHLELYSRSGSASPDLHFVPLWQLKAEINKMENDITTLETERASLAPWEAQAIDRVLPLLNDAATNTENATKYFNANRNYLWNPDYARFAQAVRRDTDQVARTLKDYLKSEKDRAEEQKLELRLSTGGD
jgi:hypothetical protein